MKHIAINVYQPLETELGLDYLNMSLASGISSITKRNRESFWATSMSTNKLSGEEGMSFFSLSGLYSNLTEAEINDYHNARDPGELKYILNPNLWCISLSSQLTCLVIHKDDCGTGEGLSGQAWRARYGGVAITKRHILYCGHAFTHAAGTWSVNTSITDPTRIRFIDSNGDTVDRIQIHQCTAFTSVQNEANENGTNYSDMTVAV